MEPEYEAFLKALEENGYKVHEQEQTSEGELAVTFLLKDFSLKDVAKAEKLSEIATEHGLDHGAITIQNPNIRFDFTVQKEQGKAVVEQHLYAGLGEIIKDGSISLKEMMELAEKIGDGHMGITQHDGKWIIKLGDVEVTAPAVSERSIANGEREKFSDSEKQTFAKMAELIKDGLITAEELEVEAEKNGGLPFSQTLEAGQYTLEAGDVKVTAPSVSDLSPESGQSTGRE